MREPIVDVIVPVHREDRRFEIALASARSEMQGIPTRLTLVLHDLPVDAELRKRVTSDVQILACRDGVPSPSGPRNVGLDAATARYVFFLDSDDWLEPHCLRRLHEVALQTAADVTLPSIRIGGSFVGTPLAASRRAKLLDPAKHFLFLRSNVPALITRTVLTTRDIRYPEGVRSGEDLLLMAQLYATARTALAFDAVYVVAGRGTDRASLVPLPEESELLAVRRLLESPWFAELNDELRQSLVRRLLAVNIAGGWRSKTAAGLAPSQRIHEELRDLLVATAPQVVRMLSVRDRASLRFAETPGWLLHTLLRRPFGVVPSSFVGLLSRRSPALYEFRSLIVRRRPRRGRSPRSMRTEPVLQSAELS